MGLGSLGAVQGMGRLRTPQNPHTWFCALQICCPFFLREAIPACLCRNRMLAAFFSKVRNPTSVLNDVFLTQI